MTGSWGDLGDSAIEGLATKEFGYISGGDTDWLNYTWSGTSGACTWSSTTEGGAYIYTPAAVHAGEIVLGGHTVTWAWSTHWFDHPNMVCYGWTVIDSVVQYDGALWAAGVYADCAGTSTDLDHDGYDADDCDDRNPSVHPGATEVCDDGVDQDCSGADADCAEDTGTTGGDDTGETGGDDSGAPPPPSEGGSEDATGLFGCAHTGGSPRKPVTRQRRTRGIGSSNGGPRRRRSGTRGDRPGTPRWRPRSSRQPEGRLQVHDTYASEDAEIELSGSTGRDARMSKSFP